jgi:hypothetical protein
MHPFQTETYVRTELEQRWRDAEQRRLLPRATRTAPIGSVLVALGERLARAGRRLQGCRSAACCAGGTPVRA